MTKLSKKNKSIKWLLFVIIIFASFIRLWRISSVPVSMFGDELDVGYHAYSIAKTGRDYSGNFMPINFNSLAEWRTPLYLYASVPTVYFFGITPIGVRLPAAIFGILSVWAIYGLVKEMLYDKVSDSDAEKIALISAAVLAFSPWHIQYSRAGFEVTMLLSFYLFGLYYFFKAIRKKKKTTKANLNYKSFEDFNEKSSGGQYLWISVVHIVITPLIYSTAKLFAPMLLVSMLIIWWKEIFSLSRKYLIWAALAGLLVGIPVSYATLFGGGADRFGYISVFTDPTRETEIGVMRETAAHFRGETGIGLSPTFSDKLFYNKFTFWGDRIMKNYFEPFSSEFLFIKGDLNLRHSIDGVGEFYKAEAIALILGLIFFFAKFRDKKIKAFIVLWILLGVIPAAITRDGGRHATRLITILPPFVFLISYGIYEGLLKAKRPLNIILTFGYLSLFALNFVSYQHIYWDENPWYSERWWHAGYGEAIESVKKIDSNYDTVLITDKNEPPWIFFAAYYNYDPTRWQQVKPDSNWVDTEKYGRVTMIDKFIFASPKGGLYDWGKEIDSSILFMASEKEVGINLILEPDRTPSDLVLLKSIAYPSGEPAFYLFTGK